MVAVEAFEQCAGRETFQHFNLVETENQSVQIDQLIQAFYLLNPILEEVQIEYGTQVILSANVLDDILTHLIDLGPDWYFRWD